MILCDTLEKKNAHVTAYFDRHGIEYRHQRLNCGDYMLYGGTVSIDRKSGLQEITHNLFRRKSDDDHDRFWRELRRSKENGIKLILLIEDGRRRSIKDVATWKPKYGTVSGRQLMNELYRVHIAYGVEIHFCSPVSTGKRIVELLTLDGKENP